MSPEKKISKKSGKKSNRAGSMGNILWQHYKELGETSLTEFKQLLSYNGIPLTTFYADTYLDKDLGSIPVARMLVYSAHFKNLDLKNIIPVKVPAAQQLVATANITSPAKDPEDQ